jgi:hypothetical protein
MPTRNAPPNSHALSAQLGASLQLAKSCVDAEDSHKTYRESDGANNNEKINSW